MTERSLKYANVAKVMDRIRAYDFRPASDRPDRYVEGVVIASGPVKGSYGYHAFTIECDYDSTDMNREGELVYVPHESTFDYDGRVVYLESPKAA